MRPVSTTALDGRGGNRRVCWNTVSENARLLCPQPQQRRCRQLQVAQVLKPWCCRATSRSDFAGTMRGKHFIIFVTCGILLGQIQGIAVINITTPASLENLEYLYLRNYAIKPMGYLKIRVKAARDAMVELSSWQDMAQDLEQTDFIQIVIGGWKNTRSAIRLNDDISRAEVEHNPLNGKEFRPFWISWLNHEIRVGSGIELFQQEFLHWVDIANVEVNNVGVSGWNLESHWMIYEENLEFHAVGGYPADIANLNDDDQDTCITLDRDDIPTGGSILLQAVSPVPIHAAEVSVVAQGVSFQTVGCTKRMPALVLLQTMAATGTQVFNGTLSTCRLGMTGHDHNVYRCKCSGAECFAINLVIWPSSVEERLAEICWIDVMLKYPRI